MDDARSPLAYARAHRTRFLADLCDLVRIPSVSGDPAHAADLRRCAAWLAGHLRRIGLEGVRVVPTARHPIVYAAWRHALGSPTLLIYGHYDVQPPDPLDEWRSPPFEPAVRGANLYGRGASDDKGQLFCHVKAIESYLRTRGRLPVNVVCVFEGEEEIGSPHLAAFLRAHRRALAADAAVISDTQMRAPNRPAIVYGLRGQLACEVTVRGQRRDLHAGTFGGALHNPIQALCELLAALHDANGHIAIPGFYDDVRDLSVAERSRLATDEPGDAEMLLAAGARHGWGEPSYSLYERTALRPALTINGISGGYQGSGGKAIIPASASAKLSFRLVPDQDPAEIARRTAVHLARRALPDMRATLRVVSSARPILLDRQHPVIEAAAAAYRRGIGAAPVFLRSGGTIPVVGMLGELLGVQTALMGFALRDDRMHAPNEKLYLPNYFAGIETCIAFLDECATRVRPRTTATSRRKRHAPPAR